MYTTGQIIGSIVAWVVLLSIYFIPTIVSNKKKNRNTGVVFILNLFFGWTIIGWVLSLCIAMWESK